MVGPMKSLFRIGVAFVSTYIFAGHPQELRAQTNDYPFANSTPDSVDPYDFYTRECTSFLAWRMNRDAGTTNPAAPSFTDHMRGGTWGNAYNWNINATTIGFAVDDKPEVGAIAQWAKNECAGCTVGHVAYVESINSDNSVNVSEYNYCSAFGFDVRRTANCNGTGGGIFPPRFIHIIAPDQTTSAAITYPVPGSTLSGSSQMFQWNAGSSIQQYFLYIGNSVGTNAIYGQSQGTNLSGTVNGLPTDGRTLYVRLWSYTTGDIWSPRDYTYTAARTSAGDVTTTLSITFSPNPATKSSDGAWYYTVYVQDTSGMAVNLTQMTIGGSDYSSDIVPWFGTTTVPAHGQISVGIKSTGNSGPLIWQFSGGGQSWSGSINLN